jgi:hypothetical protein
MEKNSPIRISSTIAGSKTNEVYRKRVLNFYRFETFISLLCLVAVPTSFLGKCFLLMTLDPPRRFLLHFIVECSSISRVK